MPTSVEIYRFECPTCPRQVFASRSVQCECGHAFATSDRTFVGLVAASGGD